MKPVGGLFIKNENRFTKLQNQKSEIHNTITKIMDLKSGTHPILEGSNHLKPGEGTNFNKKV